MPAADAFRADAVRFRALVAGDNAQARTAALFAQGLQTRGPLELDLGDRLGALLQMEVTQMPEAGTIDMKLEVVTLPVSDVDRAKRFYQSLGWRLDADIAAARADLVRRGIEISGLFHLAGGPVPGPDPEGRSYQTYASFSDPDGNGGCSRRSRRGYLAGSGNSLPAKCLARGVPASFSPTRRDKSSSEVRGR
jgi:hypothetical protein